MTAFRFGFVVLVLVSASVVYSQTSQSTAVPPVAVDQSTPKAALKSFYLAEAHCDGDAIRKIILTTQPAEEHFVAAMQDKKNADRALTDAMIKRFPDGWKVDPRVTAAKALSEVDGKIDAAVEVDHEDEASLKLDAGQAAPVTFKRVDGAWYIPFTSLIKPPSAGELDASAQLIAKQVQAMRDAAGQVDAGKYGTLTEAQAGARQMLLDASPRPATREGATN